MPGQPAGERGAGVLAGFEAELFGGAAVELDADVVVVLEGRSSVRGGRIPSGTVRHETGARLQSGTAWRADTDLAFSAMNRHWQECSVPLLRAWREDVKVMTAREAELRQAGRWQDGAHGLMEVLGVHREEVRNCAALAWVLDPAGRHGLGSLVLQGLLNALAVVEPPEAVALASVRTEVPGMGSDRGTPSFRASRYRSAGWSFNGVDRSKGGRRAARPAIGGLRASVAGGHLCFSLQRGRRGSPSTVRSGRW